MDEDIVCPFGLEDKKLLLYDDFLCWDEGVLVGAVSKAAMTFCAGMKAYSSAP